MAEFPALPLWTDAWLADTSHLDDAEQGRYFLLIINMWRAPDRRFPNDDEWLARKFRRPAERVRSELRPILAEFFQNSGNWLFHHRLEREHRQLVRRNSLQSARAKSRWHKEKNYAVAMPPCSATTTTTTTTSQEKESRPNGDARPAPQRRQTEAEPPGFSSFWAAYPRRTGKGQARRAWKAASAKAPAEAIMAGLQRAIADWGRRGTEPEFIPHPATWLNGERWADEPAAPTLPGQPPRQRNPNVLDPNFIDPTQITEEDHARWLRDQRRIYGPDWKPH